MSRSSLSSPVKHRQRPTLDTSAGTPSLIDIARYPIHELASSGAALRDDCHRRFSEAGVCLLPGFVTEHAVQQMRAEAQANLPAAYFCHNTHNAYLKNDDPSYPENHARRRRLRTDVGSIACDQLPRDGAMSRFYEYAALTEFIGTVIGYSRFYRSADPLGALSINVFEPGGEHAWHFDESHFTVTLMLQPGEQGGHFEYVPDARTPEDDNYAGVERILDGDRRDVVRMPFAPGTLSIFSGRNTLHRVTPVRGTRHRLVAVLAYAPRPNAINSDEVRKLFWGRTGREPT